MDGPFTGAKQLVAGLSILQVKSLEEAIERVKRSANCSIGDYEVEIRQVFEMEAHSVQRADQTQSRGPSQAAKSDRKQIALLHSRIKLGGIGSSVRYRFHIREAFAIRPVYIGTALPRRC